MAETLERQHVPRPSSQSDHADAAAPTTDEAAPLDLKRLLDFDWQKSLVILLTVLAGLALAWVLWQIIRPIQHTLLLFALAAALAFAFSGPVDARTHRPRDRAIATVVTSLGSRCTRRSHYGVGLCRRSPWRPGRGEHLFRFAVIVTLG